MAGFIRRDVLRGVTGALVAGALAQPAFAQAAAMTDAQVTELILDTLGADVDALMGSAATTNGKKSELVARISTWTNVAMPTDATWPKWEDSLDYLPGIKPVSDGARVELTADILKAAMRRFNYSVTLGQRTLVGVRGATLADDAQGGRFLASVGLLRRMPNHRSLSCLIGVLDHSSGKVAFFPGSTVPEFAHIRTNLLTIGGCNIMVPGAYKFVVGLHGQTKRFKQPGAFLQSGETVVLRTTRNATYAVSDADCFWDRLPSTDNLHSAVFDSSMSSVPRFSSAGCQVVRGTYNKATGWSPEGDFAAFRAAAGLKDIPSPNTSLATPDDGQSFDYVLFGFNDLAAEAGGAFKANTYLRMGSQGAAVKALQARLQLNQSGKLDAATMTKWLTAQQNSGTQEYPVGLA